MGRKTGAVIRWGITLFAVLAASFAITAPANAAEVNGSWYYWSEDYLDPSPYDAGGYDADAGLVYEDNTSCFYSLHFNAYDERLFLDDECNDDHRARAEVIVRNLHGTIIDSDDFTTGSYGDYELGTPDGEGDIEEGLGLAMRVCINGTSICSAWTSGTT